MKRGSTIFLRFAISIIGLAVLAVCIFAIPAMASRNAAADPEIAYLQYPFLAYVYIMAILFFVALYQVFRLLNYIDRNEAFSELSVNALKNIKICTMLVCGLVIFGMLYVIIFITGDRAGIVSLGLMSTFASSVIATFAAVLQKLLQNVVDIKSENDLTV